MLWIALLVLSSCVWQVKFIGPTDFAAGEWIGVELDLQEGKNDGLVNGVQYFDCREGHGLFVKKAQVYRNSVTPVKKLLCCSRQHPAALYFRSMYQCTHTACYNRSRSSSGSVVTNVPGLTPPIVDPSPRAVF